jgi:hypothetical protein
VADRRDAHLGAPGTFGPWPRALGEPERCAQLRSLASLAAVFAGSGNPLAQTLRRAEREDVALPTAPSLLKSLPSIPKRHMLSVYPAIEDAGGHI